jgi:hypothetical protein
VQLDRVQQPGVEVLPAHLGAAAHVHVSVSRGRSRLLERGLDPVGDEREAGSVLEADRLARVVGEHEDRMLERRLVAPPAPPGLVPRAGAAAEHPAAHDRGARVRDRLAQDLVVGVRLAAVPAVHLAEARQADGPLVELLAARAERLVGPGVGSRDIAVEGGRDVEGQLAHRFLSKSSSVPIPLDRRSSFASSMVLAGSTIEGRRAAEATAFATSK